MSKPISLFSFLGLQKTPPITNEKKGIRDVSYEVLQFIQKYNKNINELTYDELGWNLGCTIKYSFSRKIVTNHQNSNQVVYDYIFNCTIARMQKLLGEDIKYFQTIIKKLSLFNSEYYLSKIKGFSDIINNNQITEKEYFAKLVYILFFYAAMNRNLIDILQKKKKSINKNSRIPPTKYGIYFFILTMNSNNYYLKHPFSMTRFNNYLDRIRANISTISSIISNSNNPYNSFISSTIEGEINNRYRIVEIYYLPKNKNIFCGYELLMSNNTITNTNTNTNIKYSFLFNKSESRNGQLQLLNELCIYLKKLDQLKSTSTNTNTNTSNNTRNNTSNNTSNNTINNTSNSRIRNKKKELIMRFYYVIIFLMPFKLGTASIAEMMLYSLYQYYLDKKVVIRRNIMLDVEALMLPFPIFFDNCFNNNNKQDKYIPYLREEKLYK